MKVGARIMVLGRERAGEILSKETGIWGEFYKVKVKDGGVEYFWPFQLEKVESGIKVGDKVRIISVGSGKFKLGTEGFITSVELEGTPEEYYKVEAENDHWFYDSEQVELVKPAPEPEPKMKVGDTVEVTSRIQRGKVLFINYYVVVDVHGEALAYHPDELRLIKKADSGFKKRTICPVCHTNHEV